MSIEDEIFIKSKIITCKLEDYGFKKINNIYHFEKKIMNNKFNVIIDIIDNKVNGKIIDLSINEEYTNYRVKNMVGEFVSNIRNEYINILLDIKKKCFEEMFFISPQANRIVRQIHKKYQDIPVFPWDDSNGVFKNNDKWYALIMDLQKNKIIGNDNVRINIINVKLDSQKIKELLKRNGYYECYHMNKKSWITIILDDTLSDEEVLERIDESYNYTVSINEWIIPSSSNYGFDIVDYFNNNSNILWHQNIKINIGDVVYIYAGKPYSAILYKCVVRNKDIKNPYKYEYNKYKYVMELEVVKKFDKDVLTFELLKKYGVKAVRGQRRITKELSNIINELK